MERSAQKSATRERLLVAAAGCFAKKGYASCTVADIARAAGLAQGAMYVHFQSKEELFIEMIAREHAQGAQKARQALDTAEHLAGILAIMESCVRDVGYPVDHALWTEILASLPACSRQLPRLAKSIQTLISGLCPAGSTPLWTGSLQGQPSIPTLTSNDTARFSGALCARPCSLSGSDIRQGTPKKALFDCILGQSPGTNFRRIP